jgi:cellulose synthase/poly-beta-1,6-N-acetylglucosamine synthase-like glycosyltransferase
MSPETAVVVFGGAGFLLFYTYIGFPIVVRAVGYRRREDARPAEAVVLPTLTIVVAARNEERCIAAKVRSVLAQDYPADRLEVVIVSDASTDQTEPRVREIDDPRVRLLVQPCHSGKNSALNRAATLASGDVLVFTDANALLVPSALRRLAEPFADERVGLVSGRGLYRCGSDAAEVANTYVRYETGLKRGESTLGCLAYADGALYAIRRELYRELPPSHVHDLVHPIQIALARRLSRFEPAACTLEPPAVDGRHEYARQVRMAAQGMRAVAIHLWPLLRAGRFCQAWLLLSHRVARWCTAPLLLAAFSANAALLTVTPMAALALLVQILFYALAAWGMLAERRGKRLGIARGPYYLCLVSMAAVAAVGELIRGRTYATWESRGVGIRA